MDTPVAIGLISMFIFLNCATVQQTGNAQLMLAEGKVLRPAVHGDASSDHWFVAAYDTCLYHGSRKLGCVNWFSIAPSARYVIYETRGKTYLYDTVTESRQSVSLQCVMFPDETEWNEDAHLAVVKGSSLIDPGCEKVEIVLPS